MKQETKDLLVKMIESWNQFNPQKYVSASFDVDEIDKGCWALDVAIRGVVDSDFIAFLLPALQSFGCSWFFHAINDNVIFHIQ